MLCIVSVTKKINTSLCEKNLNVMTKCSKKPPNNRQTGKIVIESL